MGICSAVLANRRLSGDCMPESLKLEDTDETATMMVGVWRHCSRSTVRGAGYPPPTVLELDHWPDAAAVGPGDSANSRLQSSGVEVLSIVRRVIDDILSSAFFATPLAVVLSDSNPKSEPRLSSESTSSRRLTNTNMSIHNVRALPVTASRPAASSVQDKMLATFERS